MWAGSGLDVFVYFDNDQAGYAARNALSLKRLLGISQPRTDVQRVREKVA
jgi:uncharacterized protein YecE (DUF72 family)